MNVHSISRTAALSISLACVCASSTGSRRGETWLRNRHCDGRQSARHDTSSTVAQSLSWQNSSRLRERLAAADVMYTEEWPVVCDTCASVSLLYFRRMFVYWKALTPWQCMSANFMSLPLL